MRPVLQRAAAVAVAVASLCAFRGEAQAAFLSVAAARARAEAARSALASIGDSVSEAEAERIATMAAELEAQRVLPYAIDAISIRARAGQATLPELVFLLAAGEYSAIDMELARGAFAIAARAAGLEQAAALYLICLIDEGYGSYIGYGAPTLADRGIAAVADFIARWEEVRLYLADGRDAELWIERLVLAGEFGWALKTLDLATAGRLVGSSYARVMREGIERLVAERLARETAAAAAAAEAEAQRLVAEKAEAAAAAEAEAQRLAAEKAALEVAAEEAAKRAAEEAAQRAALDAAHAEAERGAALEAAAAEKARLALEAEAQAAAAAKAEAERAAAAAERDAAARAAAEAAASRPGAISVTTVPAECVVSLDEDIFEVSPFTFKDLPPGVHKVTFYELETPSATYQGETLEVEVKPGEVASLVRNLTPVPTTIYVDSMPAGATVLIGGKEAGTTPYGPVPALAGKTDIAVRLRGYREEGGRYDVPENHRNSYTFPMKRAIQTAAIKIDGKTADWESIDPLILDPKGNDPLPEQPGTDIVAVYVAMDKKNLYWRFDFADGDPTWRGTAISDQWQYCDLRISRIDYKGKSDSAIDLRVQISESDKEESYYMVSASTELIAREWNTRYAKGISCLEGSVPLKSIAKYLPTDFSILGRVYTSRGALAHAMVKTAECAVSMK